MEKTEKMPSDLPEIEKQEIADEEKFVEEKGDKNQEKSRKLWIIVLAFALLASLGVIVWLLLSGRSDHRIHGENLNTFLGNVEEDNVERLDNIDPGTVVNDPEIDLTDFDTNVTITAAGAHTLSGILNGSVLINADGPVTLNLNGVTLSSIETAALANQTENPLILNLLENTTNTFTDGGSSVYDGAIFSKGSLEINGLGKDSTLGKLIVSGRQVLGKGIATKSADLKLNSGKIMINSVGDGLATEEGGNISVEDGVVWAKAGGDGFDSKRGIVINGGNLLIMSSVEKGSLALKSSSGIALNGGNVVALGAGDLEEPSASSQKFLTSKLDSTVATGSTVYIKNLDSNRIVNFSTQGEFKTLIYSASTLTTGNYEISVDGTVVGTGEVK